MKKSIFILMLFLLIGVFKSTAQDSCWSVLLVKKGHKFEGQKDFTPFNKKGFYMYRNCIYNVATKDGKWYHGRLIDIKPDTLYFTNYFNQEAALKQGFNLDTTAIHYKNLKALNLPAIIKLARSIKFSLTNFDYTFLKTTNHCELSSYRIKVFENDTTQYEIAPHLSLEGVIPCFEYNGVVYPYRGGYMMKPDKKYMDQTYDVKNIFGFTPTKVEKINGIALGLFTENIKNDPYNVKDSLVVNGLNLELNPMGMFMFMYGKWVGPYADSIEYYNKYLKPKIENKINGLGISAYMVNETKVNGLNVVGTVTAIDEINGITLSGMSNFAYKVKGISIAGLQNRATQARGIQIGLYNKAKDLRGFQFGLWNVNGKRSLPFINWQFSKNKSRKKKRIEKKRREGRMVNKN